MWAEDYGVILQDALRHPLLHNVVTSYAGYLQVVPRVLGQPMAWLPLSWAAPWAAVVECALVAGCSIIVWNRSGLLIRSPLARGVVTAIVPFLAQAGAEVNAALIDSHWFLDVALFWIVLAPPRTLKGQLLAGLFALTTALSDPLAVVALLPAAVALIRDRRLFPQLIAPLALLSGLAIQEWVHLHEATFRFSQPALRSIPDILGLRVVLNAFVGDRQLGSVYDALGVAAVFIATALLVVVLFVLALRSSWPARVHAAVFLVGSAAFASVELILRGTGGYLTAHPFGLFPSRYFIVPIILLWSALAFLVDRDADRVGRRTRRFQTWLPGSRASGTAAVILAGVVTIEVLSGYSGTTIRSNHTTWTANLRYARAACKLPPAQRGLRVEALLGDHVGDHDAGVPVGPGDVTVYPDGEPGPGQPSVFALVLPCSLLR